ncbi:AAA family ATPase [Roseomonas sp. NAR14]|uniref:AAA family ATPase n=1 Tax=Roseomonas acroporae TaxID=2937791 RepID=A0A9X2BWY1_9PROT|nr:AAA family ATPase [Roseomonas acroporae]MCK8786596.1 AAA family ATPase [Roseomonas acroporae]
MPTTAEGWNAAERRASGQAEPTMPPPSVPHAGRVAPEAAPAVPVADNDTGASGREMRPPGTESAAGITKPPRLIMGAVRGHDRWTLGECIRNAGDDLKEMHQRDCISDSEYRVAKKALLRLLEGDYADEMTKKALADAARRLRALGFTVIMTSGTWKICTGPLLLYFGAFRKDDPGAPEAGQRGHALSDVLCAALHVPVAFGPPEARATIDLVDDATDVTFQSDPGLTGEAAATSVFRRAWHALESAEDYGEWFYRSVNSEWPGGAIPADYCSADPEGAPVPAALRGLRGATPDEFCDRVQLPWTVAELVAIADDLGVREAVGTDWEWASTPEGFATLFAVLEQERIAAGEIEAPRARWAIDGLLRRGAVSMLVAGNGNGKSVLALQMAMAVSAGASEFLGHAIPPDARGLAAYLSGEDDRAALQERIRRQRVGLGGARPLVVSFFEKEGTDLGAALAQVRAAGNVSIVVIDPARSWFKGGETNDDEVNAFMNQLRALAEEKECAVLLVHHTRRENDPRRKPKTISDVWDRARGSGVFMDRVRLGMAMLRDEAAGMTRFGVTKSNNQEEAPKSDLRLVFDPETGTHRLAPAGAAAMPAPRGRAKPESDVERVVAEVVAACSEGRQVTRNGRETALHKMGRPALVGLSRARVLAAIEAAVAGGMLADVDGVLQPATHGAAAKGMS